MQYLIKVGARDSALSRIQVEEVMSELGIPYEPVWIETWGDRDQKQSLRDLDKTNFFTKEIDEALLRGECSVAVHSAKDLPDPLPEGLEIVALTKGVDASDSLVLRENEVLRPKMVIATSSKRREENVSSLESDLYPNNLKNWNLDDAKAPGLNDRKRVNINNIDPLAIAQSRELSRSSKSNSLGCLGIVFVDIRGSIRQRLDRLYERKVDGVVIAEAALIRLKLTTLNRIKLPGLTAPLQGRLAVVARKGDEEMRQMFAPVACDTVLRT